MARKLIAVGAIAIAALLVIRALQGPHRPQARNFDAITAIEPTDEWFREKVFKNSKPVIVDFHATWCGPCRLLESTLQELQEKYKDQVEVVKVDVDAFPKLASDYHVSSIPCLLIFQQRKVVGAELGVVSYEVLESQLQPLLSPRQPDSETEPTAPPVVKPDQAEQAPEV